MAKTLYLMRKEEFAALAEKYRKELYDSVLPFWLQKSQDLEYGGYFSCLNRDGSVYDTDKFVWLQGREIWMFSMLCNQVEKKPEWLACAEQGAEFLAKYGNRFENGSISGEGLRMVKTVTLQLLRQGRIPEIFSFWANCGARILGNRAGFRAGSKEKS
jgi:hypothetical protein